SVVAALELDDAGAAGVATSQADGRHCGFRAGTDQAHLLHGWHALDDGFRNLNFGFGGCTKGQAVLGRLLHRLDNFGMSMAQDCRAPGSYVIDIARAVGVPNISALGALDESRRTADRAECADRGIDAARDGLAGTGEEIGITGHVLLD